METGTVFGRWQRPTREEIFRAVGYQTYVPEVEAFHRSEALWRFATAPNRCGKSWAGGHDILGNFVFPPMLSRWEVDGDGNPLRPLETWPDRTEQLIWIVAPHYSLCKEFDYLWKYLVQDREAYPWNYELGKAANTPTSGNMQMELIWGRNRHGELCRTIIQGKSGHNEKDLQAEEVHVCLLSEAADQEERIFRQYLVPRITHLLCPSTPKMGAEWLREIVEAGDKPEESIAVFHFPPNANPKYDWNRFRRAALQSEIKIGKANRYQFSEQDVYHDGKLILREHEPTTITEGTSCAEEDWRFAETFLGSWKYSSERILHLVDAPGELDSNVIDDVPRWVARAPKYGSLDYGWSDETCVGFWAVNPLGIHVKLAEIYESNLTPSDVAARVREVTDEMGWSLRFFAGDPQNPAASEELQRVGIPIFPIDPGKQRDRQAGEMRIVDLLAVDPELGVPRMLFCSPACGPGYGCPQTIQEFKILKRKRTVANEFNPSAFEGKDHAYDETRYFVMCDPSGLYDGDPDRRGAWEYDKVRARLGRHAKQRNKIGRVGETRHPTHHQRFREKASRPYARIMSG